MPRASLVLRFWALLLVAIGFTATSPFLHASPPPGAFAGNYELAGNRSDRTFSLEIKPDSHSHRYKISFSAAMADGSGAAPDADGTGKLEDGVLSFKFKDSFANEGTATLQPKPHSDVYQLDMVVTKMAEASPLHFYGTLLLKKIPGHATAP